MSYGFQQMVLEAWDFWCGLFWLLPYGDPYGAILTLVVLIGMTIKMLAGGEAA